MKLIQHYRVIVFVPVSALNGFIEKIQDHIPSFLGSYDRVLWHSEEGVEQSRKIGSDETNQEQSIKVEFSVPHDKSDLEALISNHIIPAHPWEEPVILLAESEIVDGQNP